MSVISNPRWSPFSSLHGVSLGAILALSLFLPIIIATHVAPNDREEPLLTEFKHARPLSEEDEDNRFFNRDEEEDNSLLTSEKEPREEQVWHRVRRGTRCSNPDIANGNFSPRQSVYRPGCVITYSCNYGYRLSGSSRRTCQYSGYWSSTTSCQPVVCGNPGTPTNGVKSGSGYTFSQTVYFSCNSGYTLQGSSSRYCRACTRWTGTQPTCVSNSCRSPGSISHGSLSSTLSSHPHGSTISYFCNTGYRLSGASSRTCLTSSQWSGSTPSCQLVNCGNPGTPVNGVKLGGGYTYGSTVSFACNTGYVLEGSSSRHCPTSGHWEGSQPTCNRILCDVLEAPSHGSLTYSQQMAGQIPYGETATAVCDSGYELDGGSTSAQRTCQSRASESTQGRWVGPIPTCQAISCSNPGEVNNGIQEAASGYTYPASVHYSCQAGYVLVGTSHLTCQADGTWNNDRPTCRACPLSTYKEGVNTLTVCTPCPDNSHTPTSAGISPEQCTCDVGYTRNHDQECTPVECEELTVPENAVVESCGTVNGETCVFACDEGYVQASGDAERVCDAIGMWSGSSIQCQACPVDQYKVDETSCAYCPEDSHTASVGSSRDDCICDAGFTPITGQGCVDNDECSDDNGGCEQLCVNSPGSYTCRCNVPGDVINADVLTQCVPVNECPALVPVANGGLVCALHPASNTQQCGVRCNPGFDHLDRVNGYEMCGPDTNWQWTTELGMRSLLDCKPAFYPGIMLEIDIFYFTSRCLILDETEIQQVKDMFLGLLSEHGIFTESMGFNCNLDDVIITCGNSTKQCSSNMTSEMEEMMVKVMVEVDPQPASDVDCLAICDRADVTDRYCQARCADNYVRHVEAEVMEMLGSDGESSEERGDDGTMSQNCVQMSAMDTTGCQPGMISVNDMCVECVAGTHQVGDLCVLCAAATYQPDERQTECLPCQTDESGNTGQTRCRNTINEGRVD